MGGKQSSQHASQYLHQRLGNVILENSKDADGQPVQTMKKVIPVQSQKEVELWLQSLNKIKNRQTLEVVLLPFKHQYEKAGMCGSGGNVTLWYEDYIFVLDNQIRNRQRIHKPFLQIQIWYLLYNMIRAAKQFQKLNEKIGDMRPANIVINEDGQIKVISNRTCPGQLSNFEKAIQSRSEHVYLAPEQCREEYIKTAQYPKTVSNTTAEMFSIGVTLLQVLTLKDCNNLYSRNPYSLNTQLLERYKNQIINSNYSEPLKQMIIRMININHQSRPRASQIYQSLLPYQNEILDLEEFKFQNYQQQQVPIQYHQQQYQQYQPQQYQQYQPYQQSPLRPVQGYSPSSYLHQRALSPSYQSNMIKKQNVQISRPSQQKQPYQLYKPI